MTIVQIEWEDSNVTHGWRLSDLFDDVAHCKLWGKLINETEDKITIAFGESNCGSIMETITIPKGCIKSIKKLRVK